MAARPRRRYALAMADPTRPSPDLLLRAARREGRGRLKIFLGAAPGVGKTFELLSRGAEPARAGVDVVAGIVETHGRADTEALVAPLEVLPRRAVEHGAHRLTELDLDALLARRPALALIDELAHTNAPGSRHPKRWGDVAELLDAGIDVYSTLNVQHLESLNDVVASFTRVRVRETVPDHVLEDAEVEVVDLPPDELIARLRDGKVYLPDEATRALGHFFSRPNLSALREMALRLAPQRVDRGASCPATTRWCAPPSGGRTRCAPRSPPCTSRRRGPAPSTATGSAGWRTCSGSPRRSARRSRPCPRPT